MSQQDENIAVIKCLWEIAFPNEPTPPENFIGRWIHYHSVDDVADVLRMAGDRHKASPLRNPGAFITATLRQREI